jgi:ferric-dicitrate binding protein FerR (iron transport regulator)
MSEWRRFGEEIERAEDRLLEGSDAVARARARFLGQASLFVSSAVRGRARRGALAIGLAASFALAVASAALFWSRHADHPALSATVDLPRHALLPGEWIAASPAGARRIDFSDGSTIGLEPGSGARVVTLSENGAHVSLEHGTANVAVHKRPGARWQVDVGPYTVAVKGTRFMVAWEPGPQRFTLSLEEGSVFVRGPLLQDGRLVATSETLRAFVAEGRLEIASGNGAALAESSAVDAVPPAAPPACVPEQASSTSTGPSAPRWRAAGESVGGSGNGGEPRPEWRALAASGKQREALAAAKARGLETVIGESSSSDLELLGDAARLGRDFETANRCYLAVRDKAPGSADAANAAFSLGKLDFDHRRLYAEAARWMEVYLAESGADAVLAREAQGRLIEAAHEAGDDRRANKAAERYLASYPNGPHAEIARRVLLASGGSAAEPAK